MIRDLFKVPLETHGSNSMICSLSGLIKFYTNIVRLNRLSDLLGLAKQKALFKHFDKDFPLEKYFERKCSVYGCAAVTLQKFIVNIND